MRIADYIIDFFERRNVEHVFTVSGGGSIFLCDALGQAREMKYVCCHHEQAASMATEAYARVRKGLGVTLVTTGPGCTNAITGVAGSWMDSVPHVTISGQVFSSQTIKRRPGLRQLGVQEINIVDIIRPITKYAVMLDEAETVRYHLEKAVYLATHGRPGPVWLDVPADIQSAKIDPDRLTPFVPDASAGIVTDSHLRQKASQVLELLKSAKRPLVHVGQGVRIAEAEAELLELVEECQIPFVTARNINDLIDWDHELYVGRPGTFAQRGANFAVQTADVYLAIGTRLSLAQTGYNAKDYARNAKVVMVDVDRAELEKGTVDIHLKIQADAKAFFQELKRQRTEKGFQAPDWSRWRAQCHQWKIRYPALLPEYRDQKGSVNSYYFIDLLSDVLTREDVVVTDMGFAFQNTHQAFRVKKGQRVFTNCGLASMGWGLPAAIGACFGNHERRTVCIAGDGGLLMTIQELATVMHHRLPIKLFVLNNGGYLTIKQTQEWGFNGRLMGCNSDSGLSFPDILKIAEAHGFPGIRIDSHDGLKEKIASVVNSDGPIVCELMMARDQVQAPKAVNRRNPDGTVKQTALEDSFPFLDPKEIEENMSIIHKP